MNSRLGIQIYVHRTLAIDQKWALTSFHTLYNVILRIARNFLENQEKHQNFDPSILPYKFGLIFIGMKQKKFFLKKNSK